jgi:1-acyl-sn-glycerol-3-phosphate acyltransferase
MVLRGDALLRIADNKQSLFSERDVMRYKRRALRQSIELLVEGRVLVIFAEGYPNIDPVYTPKTEHDEFLPFKAGFVNIASAADRRLSRKVSIIPAGLRYDEGKPWIGHMAFGEAIYRDKFSTKLELITFMERKVKGLSGMAFGS